MNRTEYAEARAEIARLEEQLQALLHPKIGTAPVIRSDEVARVRQAISRIRVHIECEWPQFLRREAVSYDARV